MRVSCCLWFVFVVCCVLLSFVACLLCVVCCVLFVVGWLSVVGCRLSLNDVS